MDNSSGEKTPSEEKVKQTNAEHNLIHQQGINLPKFVNLLKPKPVVNNIIRVPPNRLLYSMGKPMSHENLLR